MTVVAEVKSIEELKEQDPEIEPGMAFLEKVYDEYKIEGGPSWEEIKPRIESYLVHLFNTTSKKEVDECVD